MVAGAFFSSTFVLNELMASQGGHWFWSASLRYVFMWLLLSAMIGIKSGVGTLVGLCRLVDATQATEVIFSLIGGVLLLGTPMPSVMSWIGIAMVSVGIVLFCWMQS